MAGGFVAAERCFEAFLVRADEHVVGHVVGERSDLEQRGPAIGLCFTCEHVVLGQQRGQRGVTVNLKRQDFGSGQVGIAAREHLGEPVCQGQRLGLVEMRLDFVCVGHDDVGVIAVLAARHRHIEQLPRRGVRINQRVRGIDACSLGTVNRGGVAEFEFLTHVSRGQHASLAVRLIAAPQPAYSERTVVITAGDLPAVAVLDPCSAGGQAAVVEPGDDEIANTCGGAVVQTQGSAVSLVDI